MKDHGGRLLAATDAFVENLGAELDAKFSDLEITLIRTAFIGGARWSLEELKEEE